MIRSLPFLAFICLFVFVCSPSSCAPPGNGRVPSEIEEHALSDPGEGSNHPYQETLRVASPADNILAMGDVPSLLEQYPLKQYKDTIKTRIVLNQLVDHMQALTTNLKYHQTLAFTNNNLRLYEESTKQLKALKPYVEVLRDAHEDFLVQPLRFKKKSAADLAAQVNEERTNKIEQIIEEVNVHPLAKKKLKGSNSFIRRLSSNVKSSSQGDQSTSYSYINEADHEV